MSRERLADFPYERDVTEWDDETVVELLERLAAHPSLELAAALRAARDGRDALDGDEVVTRA